MSRFFPMDPHERYLREQGEILECANCGISVPASWLDQNFLCSMCAEITWRETAEQGDTCPACEKGHLKTVCTDYETETSSGKIKIPQVTREQCDECGEDILPLASLLQIEETIKNKAKE